MDDSPPELSAIDRALKDLADDARELYLDSQVPRIRMRDLSPLVFHRSWVSTNKPVIVVDAIADWPALTKWTSEYLRAKVGSKDVTVAVTPNGYADAVTNGLFTLPEERKMKFAEFLDIINGRLKKNGVYYMQRQNSNLTEDFAELVEDARNHIDWATEAFGKMPDAVNFWMGEEKAVTSMHKDHYENIYCVISGSKTFILHPPTDQPFIPFETFPVAEYKEDDAGNFLQVRQTASAEVPWITINPLDPDFNAYPRYRAARPIKVTVKAGELLYLPSLWFHHVQQTHGCIAVNYWYDMEFDIKYSYFKMVESLTRSAERKIQQQ